MDNPEMRDELIRPEGKRSSENRCKVIALVSIIKMPLYGY
jgi:hypothetical protein